MSSSRDSIPPVYPTPDETNLKDAVNPRWGYRLAVLLTAVAAVRVAFILFAPLELSGDEAQYWDWSRHMAWGYFSKGPVVAACIWLGRMLFGETALAVRGPAVVLAAGAGVAIFLLGRRLYDGRVGFWAALLSQVVPIFAAFGIGMTADPPFLLCWSLALLLMHRAAADNRWADWLGLAIVLGVGLNAKYTMGLFYPCAMAYLLTGPQRRRLLLGVRPWLAVAISLAMLGPLLWWDSRHGWVNLMHNAGHTGYGSHSGLKPLGLLKFLGTQLAMVTPVLAVMGVWAVVRRARRDPFCFWFSIPVLALFMVKSVSGHDYANWTLPAYVTMLFAFAAKYLRPPVSANGHIRRLTRSAWLTPVIATPVIMLLVMLGHFSYLLDDAGLPARLNPYRKLTGWAQVGRAIARLPEAKTDFIICNNRQLTSRLAFYIPGHPRTYQMDVNPARVTSQYQLEPGYWSFIGRDAICVVEAKRKQKLGPDGKPLPPRLNPLLAKQFKRIDPPIWPTARDARGRPIYHCAVYIAHDYLGQPAAPSTATAPSPNDDEDEDE